LTAQLAELVAGLRAAPSFEAGAAALLAPLLARSIAALQETPRGRRATVLRGWVHRRGERSYQAIHGVECDSGSRGSPAASASAWRVVQQTAAPVVVDIEAQRLMDVTGRPLPVEEEQSRWGEATRAQMQARSTTHLLAIPLRGPSDKVIGLAAIEVACPAAVGTRFPVWVDAAAGLQLLCDVATPVLANLAPAPVEDALADRLLPVVGATMAPVVRMLAVFATYDAPLLIRGSTGTGKTHLAEWAHARSARSNGPFESVALHAVAETLRVGELFGWKRGAFTGADRDYEGSVTRARNGTIFLDEIDKLDLDTQAKLLGVLEDGTYRSLGDSRTRKADVRFIVGTNAELETEVREGRFLRDLYYRIHVLPVELPDLRDRADEVEDWARWMLARVPGPTRGRVELIDDAAKVLRRYDWPGNLRQLHSVIVRATALESLRAGHPSELSAEAVRRSLALEGVGGDDGVVDTMDRAAEAFVRAAQRLAPDNGEPSPIQLDQAEALRGLVLEAAVRLTGSERDAFELFGLHAQLKHGNHKKTLRRELARVDALRQTLGEH